MNSSDTVAIIGAGLIGCAWAAAFARAGCTVRLWDAEDRAADRAIEQLGAVLRGLAEKNLLDGQDPADVQARATTAPELEAALDGASYVQENVPEDLKIKRDIFRRMDAIATDDVILASSTSALLPSSFTEALAGRARCLVAHPVNPPYLIPAVEIVPAPWTAPEIVERAAALMDRIGQSVIRMEREINGFVVNRLQGALLDEAFRLVAEDYADTESVDRAVRDGLGLRWFFMGPFETIDLNAPEGVRDYVSRYDGMYERLAGKTRQRVDWTGEVLDRIEAKRRERLPAGRLAERQRWRDQKLMALKRWRRDNLEG